MTEEPTGQPTGEAATPRGGPPDLPAARPRGVRGDGQSPRAGVEGGAESPREGRARSAWDDPRLPWAGRPRPADIACWAAITCSGLYYLLILPFRATLVGTHPVLLEMLNGTIESIVAAAAFARTGHGTLAVAVLAAFVGMMKFDLIYWWAGRLWGERIVLLMSGRRKAGTRYMARVQRWGRRFTWPVMVASSFLPIPSPILFVIVGWAGMSWPTFLVLDLIGSGLWIGVLTGLGYALGQHAVSLAEAISRYGLWISIGIVVLVVAGQIRGSRMQKLPARLK